MSYTPTEWESTDVVTATRMNALEQAVGDMNMSYTPNVWSDGDILSADKMNALEQAVASGGGSGEFSTATVNVVSDAKVVEFYAEIDYDTSSAEQDIYNRNAMLIDNNNCFVDDIVTEGTESFNVHYSKGHYYITGPNPEAISISGNASLVSITFAGETFQSIKGVGDCTITIYN